MEGAFSTRCFDMSAALTSCVDRLQESLEEKQRALQSLRLRVSFAQSHELRLEEQQWLVRSVALQRKLAARVPEMAATLAPLTQRIALVAVDSNVAMAEYADFGDAALRGWAELDRCTGQSEELSGGLQMLKEGVERWATEAALAAEQSQPSPEDEVAATEQEETRELQRRKLETETELKRLRESCGPSTVQKAQAVAKLVEEARRVRQEVARLRQQVGVLRRQTGPLPT